MDRKGAEGDLLKGRPCMRSIADQILLSPASRSDLHVKLSWKADFKSRWSLILRRISIGI